MSDELLLWNGREHGWSMRYGCFPNHISGGERESLKLNEVSLGRLRWGGVCKVVFDSLECRAVFFFPAVPCKEQSAPADCWTLITRCHLSRNVDRNACDALVNPLAPHLRGSLGENGCISRDVESQTIACKQCPFQGTDGMASLLT